MSNQDSIEDNNAGAVKITVLYDNNPLIDGLQTDWGFSCLVETRNNKILFDTGDNGKILLDNMKKLGVDPKSIDTVFLSHFHHDHTGGLKDFLKENSKVKVYYPQSFPADITDIIHISGADAVPVSKFMELLPEIFTLGELEGKIPEQSLAIRKGNELIVITGCAHPGIINILERAKEKFPDEIIYLALGGFHLHRLDVEEINKVIQKMFELEIITVAPTHCTGNTARNMFKEVFDADYEQTGAGKVFNIK